MQILGITADQAASGDPASLRQYLEGLSNLVAAQQTTTGTAGVSIVPPAAAGWNVSSKDGVFVIDIVPPQNAVPASIALHIQKVNQAGFNPNSDGSPIYYQLQSATNTKWDGTGDVITYGSDSGDSKLHWEIRDPNQTKFWRFRSKYQGSDWSKWITWSDPQFCGPVAVWSGLLRTTSLSYLNSQAQTTDGSNALSQDGTTTRILMAAKTWNVGTQKVAYLAGSADPGIYGTFYVYGIDVTKAGGTITLFTTQNPGDLSAQDGLISFGFISTSGGGGGTGGGGGSCHVAGTMIEMYDGSFKDCSLIHKGDEIKGTDDGKEIAQADAEAVPNVPCFSLVFDNGVTASGVSTTEPIMLAPGNFIKVFDAMVGMTFQTRAELSILGTKTFLGNRTVYRQRLDRTKTYWADGLASHNMKIQ